MGPDLRRERDAYFVLMIVRGEEERILEAMISYIRISYTCVGHDVV